MTSISIKTPYYNPWFLARISKFDFRKKRMPGNSTYQEEQNDANFSAVALSVLE